MGQEASPAQPEGLVLGIESVGDDGRSALLRVRLAWRDWGLEVGATGQFWDGYDLLEPELKWLPTSRRSLAPVFSVSTPLERTTQADGVGLAVSAGLESYPIENVALSFSLGWRSLFRRYRRSGYLEPIDGIHWFRVRFGVNLLLGG